MYTLITNTGKKHKCSFFGFSYMNHVTATILDENIGKVAAEFSNPEETAVLTSINEFGTKTTATGYTVLDYLERTENGVKVALTKPPIVEKEKTL